MMIKNLVFQAGDEALKKIREKGLQPGDVKAMAAAAGGPKWLIMGNLDKALFNGWFKGRKEPLFLVGSSSGAWRFACASQNDPVAAVDRFADAYIHQYYRDNPGPEEISREGIRIQNAVLGHDGPSEILSHPFLRLNIMAVTCRGIAARDEFALQALVFSLAFAANIVNRKSMGLFFKRALFFDPRDLPPFFSMNDFPIRKFPLKPENLHPALLASGSIPLLMNSVKNIPGAPNEICRDGGVIDYHMDLPYNVDDGIVLFPHYTNRVIPGWLDKKIFWRKPERAHMKNVLLVSPSRYFLDKLPLKKIPDRNDFYLFKGKDRERTDYWKKAADFGKYLAEDFIEAMETGAIKKIVTPYFGKS